MKIAIPTANGKLNLHFGHCDKFVIFDTDPNEKKILSQSEHIPPTHEPGVLPEWLRQQQVSLVIAGGMGQRAQQLFVSHGINVLVGAPCEEAEQLVKDYFAGTLATGINACDH